MAGNPQKLTNSSLAPAYEISARFVHPFQPNPLRGVIVFYGEVYDGNPKSQSVPP